MQCALLGDRPVGFGEEFARPVEIARVERVLEGLQLGDEQAKAVQLTIEYDPHPAFDSGSVEKASPALVNKVKACLLEYSRKAAGVK